MAARCLVAGKGLVARQVRNGFAPLAAMGQATTTANRKSRADKVQRIYEAARRGSLRADDAPRLWRDRRVWLLIGLALLLRVPGLDRPLLGNFATKNVAYAMIAQNWATGHAPLWHPTLHVLRDGGPGLHLLEVPLAAYVAGGLWHTFGGSLDFWGRAVSVVCIAAAVALLYGFVRRRHGTAAATAAAAMLAISPVSIIYGQSFMLEASVALLSIAALDAADRYARRRSRLWLAASAAWYSLLVLTKIYMGVLLLPLAWIVWQPTEEAIRRDTSAADTAPPRNHRWSRCFAALFLWGLALLPAGLWYLHVMEITAADSPLVGRAFYSLRDSQTAHHWPPPELFSADFYRQVLDDLATVALTPIGFTLLLLGLCRREARQHWPWLLSAAVLIVVLPRKFYAMNYYYLAILPPLAVMVGLGWKTLAEALSGTEEASTGFAAGRAVPVVLLAAALLFSLRYAAKPAFVTPEEDRSVLAAAAACREVVPEGEAVATLHGTTIDLLYYCNRQGWVLPPAAKKLSAAAEAAAQRGARFLVVANLTGLPRDTQHWLNALPRQAGGVDYAVFALPVPEAAKSSKRDLD